MAITLYGDARTLRVCRNSWMLRELALPHAYVRVCTPSDCEHRPEFLKLNPNGRVPVLKDNGFVLCESLAINLYLARQYPGPLSARGAREEALIEQWSFWVMTEIEKPLAWALGNLKQVESGKSGSEEAALALEKLTEPLQILDRHVGTHEYLVGDRFTVADLNVAAALALTPPCGMDFGEYPAMRHWLARALERPAAEDWSPIGLNSPPARATRRCDLDVRLPFGAHTSPGNACVR